MKVALIFIFTIAVSLPSSRVFAEGCSKVYMPAISRLSSAGLVHAIYQPVLDQLTDLRPSTSVSGDDYNSVTYDWERGQLTHLWTSRARVIGTGPAGETYFLMPNCKKGWWIFSRLSPCIKTLQGLDLRMTFDGPTESATLSPDGKKVRYIDLSSGWIRDVDVANDKNDKVVKADRSLGQYGSPTGFSQDSHWAYLPAKAPTVKFNGALVNLVTGKTIEVQPKVGEDPYDPYNDTFRFSKSGRWLAKQGPHGITIVDTRTSASFDIPIQNWNRMTSTGGTQNTLTFDPDEGRLAIAGSKRLMVIDLNKRAIASGFPVELDRTSDDPGPVRFAFAPDGKVALQRGFRLAVASPDGRVTQKEVKHHHRLEPDGRLGGGSPVLGETHRAVYQDVFTNRPISIVLPIDITGITSTGSGREILHATTGQAYILTYTPMCIDRSRTIETAPIESDTAACDPDDEAAPLSPGAEANLMAVVQKLAFDGRCTRPYNKQEWESATRLPASGPIPERVALANLEELQREGAWDSKRHLAVLHAAIKSPLLKSHPDAIFHALSSLYLKSRPAYDHILQTYPFLTTLKIETPKPACRTPEEDTAHRHAIIADITKQTEDARFQGRYLKDWEFLGGLKGTLVTTPDDEQNELMLKVSDTIARKAAQNEFNRVFEQELSLFAREAMSPYFNGEVGALSDVVVTSDPEAPVLLQHILGTKPINGKKSSPNAYGFYAETIGISMQEYAQEQPKSHKVTWSHDGRVFSSTVTVTIQKPKNLVDAGTAPKYDEMWKDGKLVGTVVANSTLKNPKGVMGEYEQLYRSKGYEFANDAIAVDVPAFLRDHVRNDGDYLVKEAHNDGDFKNLFRMAKNGLMRKGMKKLPDGREEIVYLIYPAEKTPTDFEYYSNEVFGEDIRARESARRGQLVYFNASCSSVGKAAHEVRAARSPTLLEIPTRNWTDTFVYRDGNIMYELMNSFLEQKDYNGIRQALSKNTQYSWGLGNGILLPDEDSYQKEVNTQTKVIDISAPVINDRNEVMAIDAQLDEEDDE